MNNTKKQIVVIHGGDTFDTYEEYIKHLKKAKFNPDRDENRGKRWNRTLGERLGNNFTVLFPTMPCKYNAKYKEWNIWFEKLFPYIKDNVVLIGHSLGGTFLAKYLSENSFPKKISATYLVAAPYDDKDSEDSLGDFVLPDSLEKFEKQGGRIFIYQSKNDPFVPFVEVEKYTKALPRAEKKIFETKGHFMREEFPELIESIRRFY